MRWIYISPHLDDAVLSAGGFIFDQTQAGNLVEIWTIICGIPSESELTPFAQKMHQEWGTKTAEETVKLRRLEDMEAAGIVGAKSVHFDIPDCIYRRGPDGEPLYMDIYVEPHEAESNLPTQIAKTVLSHLNADDQIICQLGVGKHIDHVIVRQAMERLHRPLWYTADVPYLFWFPEQLSPLIAGMDESQHAITEAGLKAWTESVLAYKSQISTLFDNHQKVEADLRSYYAHRDGFPIWRVNSPVMT